VDQRFHPVYYYSDKTTPAEYSSYELEVLAIIKALKKFRVYKSAERFSGCLHVLMFNANVS